MRVLLPLIAWALLVGFSAPIHVQSDNHSGDPFHFTRNAALVALTPGLKRSSDGVDRYETHDGGGTIERDGRITGTHLRDGRWIATLPLGDGSGGTFSTFVYLWNAGPHYVGTITSSDGHLETKIVGSFIVATLPRFAPGDGSCCPSGHRTIKYVIRANRLTSTP